MTHHRPLNGETPHPSRPDTAPAFWTVEILADSGALSRIVDLMAKLAIEPQRLEAMREPCGEAVRINLRIPAGDDAARLATRLSGIIQIRSVAATPHGGAPAV